MEYKLETVGRKSDHVLPSNSESEPPAYPDPNVERSPTQSINLQTQDPNRAKRLMTLITIIVTLTIETVLVVISSGRQQLFARVCDDLHSFASKMGQIIFFRIV